MTELQYVLEGFERRLSELKNKRIILHGSRDYARSILERYRHDFCFVGIMSREPTDGIDRYEIPVYPETALDTLDVDAVLLTERVKYAEAVYETIHTICEQKEILLYNMYGINEIAAHQRIAACRPLSVIEWKKICLNYDVIAFEAMDVFLNRTDAEAKLQVRTSLCTVASWLLDRGKDVAFSLRKSFPEEPQIEALKSTMLCKDIQRQIIRREGEDLSFRKLKEENPDKKILYIGRGLVNECILPLCYEIDTYRFCFAPPHFSNLPLFYMSIGNKRAERTAFDSSLKERILRSIQECDIISFDIFDTLLVRKTLIPEDVFALVEKRQMERGMPIAGFAKDRIAAGNEFPCTNIYEIYARLREKRGWTEVFSREILQLELETEWKVTAPRKEMTELFTFAANEGKRLALVSDMYLPAEILEKLLKKNGIAGYEKLLVSCDCRKEKRSGLFEELRRLSKPGERILHIGDHPENDGEISKAYGIESYVLPSPLKMAGSCNWQDCVLAADTLMERCLVGMTVADLFCDPFQNPNLIDRPSEERLHRFAVSVLGPLTIGYLTWLMRELKSFSCDGVLFLARDGYFPMRVYQHLCLSEQLPPAFYYYTSRHSAFLCCADDEKQIGRIIELGHYSGVSVSDLLQIVYGLTETAILERQNGESEEDYIKRHMSEISLIAEEERASVQHYSDQIGLKREGAYAVVDCIAEGTTQWFMEQWMPYHLEGFYFGNYSFSSRKSRHIRDYLKFYNDSLLRNYIEIESYFSSAEPSVSRMAVEGVPVFADEQRDEEGLTALKLVQHDAFQFAAEFFDLFYSEGETIDPCLPEEMFAADGCHWVPQLIIDDWTGRPIPTKQWDAGERIGA